MKRIAVLLVIVAVTGCNRPTPEERLGITYNAPVVPDDVPERYAPPSDTKLYTWLEEGETHLNLKEHYRSTHRWGWDCAIDDWTRSSTFSIKSKEDAFWHHADIQSGTEAFWIGYSEARRQIEAN